MSPQNRVENWGFSQNWGPVHSSLSGVTSRSRSPWSQWHWHSPHLVPTAEIPLREFRLDRNLAATKHTLRFPMLSQVQQSTNWRATAVLPSIRLLAILRRRPVWFRFGFPTGAFKQRQAGYCTLLAIVLSIDSLDSQPAFGRQVQGSRDPFSVERVAGTGQT